MDFRKTYDAIPQAFDKWRPRYCPELFSAVIAAADIGPGSRVLEIGPGTGQATEPLLKTGCGYLSIELGENFTAYNREKFEKYPNFHIVNGDFETWSFGEAPFDLVYSAATIQWIPEGIAFPKVYRLLKSGGTLAMFMTRTDTKASNGALYDTIQEVYANHFQVDTHYTCRMDYTNVLNYGFTGLSLREWKEQQVLTGREYVEYMASTMVEHITLKEPYRAAFFGGVQQAVEGAGDRIRLDNTMVLYTVKKPCI